MKFGVALGLVVVTAGALVLRLPQLSQRPMHADESVHAVKFLGLWEDGAYRYDPHEYHGPSLYYAALPAVWLSGVSDRGGLSEGLLRLTPVVFGVGLILLLLLARSAMGGVATLWAAVFLALSPAMVFYSRYFIHETLLVTFTFGFLVCGWRYWQKPGRGWMAATGLCLGLMQATKETFVFPVLAAIGAALALCAWRRFRCEPLPERRWRKQHLVWGAGAFVLVSVVLFTSFFQNWQGPLDAWRTYGPWLERAEGKSPHVHPWYYYASVLLYTQRGSGPLWSEGLILILGMVGMATSLLGKRAQTEQQGWGRLLTFYTLFLTAAYMVVPYKTPWCVLGFWHGWIMLAGVGVAACWRWKNHRLWRAGFTAALVVGVAHLALQANRAAFRYADSQRNPYVYAHTLSSLVDLAEMVDGIVRVSPRGSETVVKVLAEGGDYWPLPWYLRQCRAGWYTRLPEHSDEAMADILIASPQFEPALHSLLGDQVLSLGMFGLRPGVFLQLHVESHLWEAYLNRARVEGP